MVTRFKFSNTCDYDLALVGWDCRIPAKNTCYVGENETCAGPDEVAGMGYGPDNSGYRSIIGRIQNMITEMPVFKMFEGFNFMEVLKVTTSSTTTGNELLLPLCSDVSKERSPTGPQMQRVQWYIIDSLGLGEDPNYHVSDFVEVNSNWLGAGHPLTNPPTFSSWNGFSMSRSFVALTTDEDQLGCIDAGGKTTVADPIRKAECTTGRCEYECGYKPFQTTLAQQRPFFACVPPDVHDPSYLKSKAVAIGPTDGPFLSLDTCRGVEYPCIDQCVTGAHNWPQGTFLCGCEKEIVLSIQACNVTA